jgi:uncharacterized protein YabN with tetrapyrrole methylase and pyrophosphatase domain
VAEELGEVTDQLVASPPAFGPSGAPILDEAHARLEDELGDLLFACVNLCRKAGVHAALALDHANAKFARRFQAMERLATERGLNFSQLSLAEQDVLWDQVKKEETLRA